jgi:hypothetical protein
MSKWRTGSARDRQRSEDVPCSRGRSRRWWSWKGQAKLTIGRYVRTAHASLKEHQLAEYVARLEIEECARILAAAPEGLLCWPLAETRFGSVPAKGGASRR